MLGYSIHFERIKVYAASCHKLSSINGGNGTYMKESIDRSGAAHYCFAAYNTCNSVFFPRVHIPIADECHLGCFYCDFVSNGNQGILSKKPGVCDSVIWGHEGILNYLEKNLRDSSTILGVSGPGDPFSSEKQMSILFDVINNHYPDNPLCICSSGFGFPSIMNKIDCKRINFITLTINTFDQKKYSQIYKNASASFSGEYLSLSQKEALDYFLPTSSKVKVNTVFLPDINENEIVLMFKTLYDRGVECFNLLPMSEDKVYLDKYNVAIQQIIHLGIPLLQQCLKCRSDSCYGWKGL